MSEKKVKKHSKKKRRLNFKRVFLLVLVILTLVFGIKYAYKINVSSVQIIGNNNVLDNKIIKLASLDKKTSFLGLNKENTCKKILTESLIASCKIIKKINLKIIIEVSENYPLFYYKDTNKLILSNGVEYDALNTYGVPNLINYVPIRILSLFVDGLKDINSDIIRGISEIEYTPSLNSDGTYIDEERFMLSMKDTNIVYVNIKNINILNSYNKIYASNGDKKGIYNLDSDYGIYYFKEFESK